MTYKCKFLLNFFHLSEGSKSDLEDLYEKTTEGIVHPPRGRVVGAPPCSQAQGGCLRVSVW